MAEFGVDRLSAVLLLLVFGVSGIVQAFAVRYLAGDPRSAWFAGGAGLLTAASAGLATASTLVTLALCWTIAGAALALLLATYWHLPAARDGVRRTATAFVIGDLALWTAVALATATWGRVDLRADGQLGGSLVPIWACWLSWRHCHARPRFPSTGGFRPPSPHRPRYRRCCTPGWSTRAASC